MCWVLLMVEEQGKAVSGILRLEHCKQMYRNLQPTWICPLSTFLARHIHVQTVIWRAPANEWWFKWTQPTSGHKCGEKTPREIISHCNVKQLHLAQSVGVSMKNYWLSPLQCDLLWSATTMTAAQQVLTNPLQPVAFHGCLYRQSHIWDQASVFRDVGNMDLSCSYSTRMTLKTHLLPWHYCTLDTDGQILTLPVLWKNKKSY